MEKINSRSLWVLSSLFLIALAVRVVYLSELSRFPYFDTVLPVYDHYNFDQGALNFAAGDALARSPNNSYSPLYKYFLGSIYFLFGRNFYVVYGLQFMLGSCGAVLMFLIGKKLFDSRVGLLAFAGFSFYSTEIIYEGIILRAAFITFLAILSFFILLRLREYPTPLMLTACAMVLSLFFQSRPNTFLCLPFVIFYIHKYVFENCESIKRLRGWGMFLIPLLISFVPLLVQCYFVHGRFIFFDSSGPTAFMAGNFIDYPGVGFDLEKLNRFQKKYEMEDISLISFILQQVMNDPIGLLKMIGRKLYFYFNDLEGASNLSIYLYQENSRILPYLINHFSLFSSLGIMGVLLATWKREKLFLLYSFLACMMLSVVLFHVVSRFRIPSAPFLILFASYAVGKAIEWWRSEQYKSLAVFILTFLIIFYGLQVPAGYAKSRYVDYCNWSYAYLSEEKWFDVDKAETYGIRCLEEERKMNPGWEVTNETLASIYKLYGSYLIQQGDDTAGKILKYAFSIDPFDSELYRMYSDFELGRKRIEPAIRYLHISLVANVNNAGSLKNLIKLYYKANSDPGKVLAALNAILPIEKDPDIFQKVEKEILRLEGLLAKKEDWIKTAAKRARKNISKEKWLEALTDYEEINAFNASDALFLIDEGLVYEYLDNERKALDSFYDALLIQWNNPELNKNIGNYYLSSGNVILALLHWKRYLKTAPQSKDFFLIRNQFWFHSRQLRMKSLEKQIFGLSGEQNQAIYRIYLNMDVKFGS